MHSAAQRIGVPPLVTKSVPRSSEPAETPRWSSCVGHTSGLWTGQRAAFSPHTGHAEAFALNASNRRACDASTIRTAWPEHLNSGTEGALTERSLWRMHGDVGEFEFCDEERIVPDEPGLCAHTAVTPFEISFRENLCSHNMHCTRRAFWEVGERSRGPRSLDIEQAHDSGAASYAPTACTFDTCLHNGSQRRARTKLNVAISAPLRDSGSSKNLSGLDLNVLSLGVNVEDWAGPAETAMADRVAQDRFLTMEPLSRATPLDPQILAGEWRVFERSGVPTTDHDGNDTFEWRSSEIEQVCSVPSAESSGEDASPEEPGEAGWALWLPEGIWTGIEYTSGGGLRIKVGWMLRENVQQVIMREYRQSGELEEVSASFCVRGGWEGGAM